MLTYFGKRLLLGVVTIWFIASATFFGMHAVPGDPLAGDKAMALSPARGSPGTACMPKNVALAINQMVTTPSSRRLPK